MKTPNGFIAFSEVFPDKKSCIEYYEQIKWKDNIVSPFDKYSKVYKYKNGKYRCKNTGKYFDVKTGTIFAYTKLPLRCWFYAMFLLMSNKKGATSYKLAEYLNITQKTAWKMLTKIRSNMGFYNNHKLSGEVEVDETFVGGKNKNRHWDKKVEKSQGRSFKDKTPVFGMLQRNGIVVCKVIPNTAAKTLESIISEYVEHGSVIYTDGWEYGNLKSKYIQRSVDHGAKLYGKTEVTDDGEIISITTNGIENVWSHFKRMIIGTHYHVSKKHLQKYVDEYVFRFNTRNTMSYFERFELFLCKTA